MYSYAKAAVGAIGDAMETMVDSVGDTMSDARDVVVDTVLDLKCVQSREAIKYPMDHAHG